MAILGRIQIALEEIYSEAGYRSAAITHEIEELSSRDRRVLFTIDEGGKFKIDEIDFVGNEIFSDRRLRRQLKETKQTRWYRLFSGKTVFLEEGWEDDKENVRKYYLNHGYKDAKVGRPEVEVVITKPDKETLKDQKHRLHITVPVEEGEQYTLGAMSIKGGTVFSEEFLQRAFEVRPGSTYSYKEIETGMEQIRDLYHNSGYIYAYTNQVLTDREDEERVVDVVIDVFEGDRFRLGRLEFVGNTVTRDKVLRREFRLAEGDWMRMGVFRSSVYKVNALGYFKLEEEPLDFDFDDENKIVNVKVKGNEVGKNDVQFGAGYSELYGFFGQFMFNTRNFLGRGETLGVSAQVGAQSDYYTLTFTEPYLFDRRMLLGASIFKTNIDIADFVRENTGAHLTVGYGLGIFGSVSALLSYEDVLSRFAVVRSGLAGDQTGGHRRPTDIPGLDPQAPEVAEEVFRGTTTAIMPSYGYDSRDDPFDPNRGKRIISRIRFAGGPLGGDYDYVRPELQFTAFQGLGKRTTLGLNLEVGQFFTYNESDLPIYERYRLGGDRTIRGIPYYTVVPRTESGEYFLTPGGSQEGGDRYWLANFEYQFRIGGPVKIVVFADLGNAYHEQQGWDWGLMRKTTGLELRIFLPMFQAPIRFIYGYNIDPFPEEEQSDFQFSIGTTF
jgi:outer membrane protein insertion porin family